MDIQQKKLHIFSFFVFILLVFSFYILGGGTNIEDEVMVDSFNTSLPEANLEDLSENRLDAIYRAEQRLEQQKRLENRQRNSFAWLIEQDSVPSVQVAEELPVEIEEEEPVTKPRSRRRYSSGGLSDRERFELEKQKILEQKRRELERQFGIADTKAEEKNEPPAHKPEIIVGKRQNKGFYSLQSDEEDEHKPDIRALVHGEYRNIKTGAIVKFRIIDEFTIDGVHIPKNTFLYGQLSFSSSRAMIKIENIQYKNMIIPFNASIYDEDGFEGIYTPDNIVDEAKRDMANDVISSTNLNISGGLPLITGAVNAATSAIKSISQTAVKEKKLNISSNYQVNIRYE